jgi:hypothetical protein
MSFIGHEVDLRSVIRRWNWELDLTMELEYGLLDDLVSRGLMNPKDVRVIECNKPELKRQNRVLDVIVNKMATKRQLYPRFVGALRRTRQEHVGLFVERKGRKYSLNI